MIQQLKPVDTGVELIRLGPRGDGGYLLPDDLNGIAACFSPGVHTQIAFDTDIANRGVRVHLADASVTAPEGMTTNMSFLPKYVGSVNNETTIPMDDWVRHAEEVGDHDLMLQMDIEGAEYEVLMSMSEALLKRHRIIAVEFHMLQHLWNPGFFFLARAAFQRLLASHYCVHIHPNNFCGVFKRGGIEIPVVMEFTFHRKDRLRGTAKPIARLPHPLDADNKDKPPITLPSYWWQSS
ncbi:MAG: FkbM family methyltransferase [Cyanobium sp.]